MPIPVLGEVYYNGIQAIPHLALVLRTLPWLGLLWLLKIYFNGTQNSNERLMHSRVAIITGGTSGIGAAVVEELAARGAQLILLVKDPSDIFTVDYIEDLRERHGNELIYAEKCDLADLHSVRLFATKYIDNSPPRRLDMVICCAGLMAPPGAIRTTTKDGVEAHMGTNYLGHFHLLNLLAPVLRIQPPDRDVRILLATCVSHMLGELDLEDLEFTKRGYPSRRPWRIYGASKLALMIFGVEFQRRLAEYKRPDKEEMNARVYSVDPGIARTPGSRRWFTFGSLWGLAIYLITWPIWWLMLKSPDSAAQTFLAAVMSPECGQGEGGKLLRECKNVKYNKKEITDPEVGKKLCDTTEKFVAKLEKESAKVRAAEANKAGKKKEEENENDKQLKERAVKAKEAAMRRELLEKLIKEEEAKQGALAVPPGPLQVPDTRARNTRSQTPNPTPTPEPEPAEKAVTPARSNTPSRNTRRRTRKA